ncbi:thioesterase [Pseudoalteromonas sp. CO348]|uniref:thioesterase II family protein n=1 Tax=unclassified Pseudoalteromonas TaxID=194690 RepID=UPI00102392DD|nr:MULTISPECIES: thioesterase domain-containing protein [unclassified Pseudoalteromonas]MCG7540023.1 thioesterase domain-containing protein [Pseudoalteromonas sp. OF7H-1]RZG07243.1 thioesterase [Pseudoalteromonas sp. CO348]
MPKSLWYEDRFMRSDSEINLICIPYAGGGPQIFYKWAEYLPEFVSMFPVYLPGRFGRIKEKPISNMRKLVDILVNEISVLTNKKTIIFGHSLGALIGYQLVYRFYESGLNINHFISSGCRAPDLPYLYEGLFLKSDDDFKRALIKIGATKPEFAFDETIYKVFSKSLRADFKLAEWKIERDLFQKIDVNSTVLYGDKDVIVSESDIKGWSNFFNDVEYHSFSGKHFFIDDDVSKLFTVLNNVFYQNKVR